MESGMRRNAWIGWLGMLLVAHSRPGHGGDAPPDTASYVRFAGAAFATECKFRIAREPSGWRIVSRTDRGTVQMEVETRYNAYQQPVSARVVLTQNGTSKTANVLVKDGKATVTREGQPSETFDAPKGTIVTSAPDWTDVFLLCRHYDRRDKEKQEFPALWIHPIQPPQRLTFSIELQGKDAIEHDGKKVELSRFEIMIRGSSRYVAWADPQGRMVRLIPLPLKGTASGLTLEGYEKSVAGLRPARQSGKSCERGPR
jgi:hypothetical protein